MVDRHIAHTDMSLHFVEAHNMSLDFVSKKNRNDDPNGARWHCLSCCALHISHCPARHSDFGSGGANLVYVLWIF